MMKRAMSLQKHKFIELTSFDHCLDKGAYFHQCRVLLLSQFSQNIFASNPINKKFYAFMWLIISDFKFLFYNASFSRLCDNKVKEKPC